MTASIATADHVFCDADAVVDIAKAGGRVVDGFLEFIGHRGRLVLDVQVELKNLAKQSRQFSYHLQQLLDRWDAAQPGAVHKLTVAESERVAVLLDMDAEDAVGEKRAPDKGETATAVYVQGWIKSTVPEETVIAMTDRKGTDRAEGWGIECCAFRELAEALEAGGFITEVEREHAIKMKYGPSTPTRRQPR